MDKNKWKDDIGDIKEALSPTDNDSTKKQEIQENIADKESEDQLGASKKEVASASEMEANAIRNSTAAKKEDSSSDILNTEAKELNTLEENANAEGAIAEASAKKLESAEESKNTLNTNENTKSKIANNESTNILAGSIKKLFSFLKANPWIVVLAAMAGVYTIGKKLADVNKEVAETAGKVADQYDTAKKSIDDYTAKIKELKDKISDENSSVSDVTEARKELYSIQSQLMEQYKGQPTAIDAITAAINGETDAVDKLNDSLTNLEYNKAIRDLNKEDFWKSWSNEISGYANNVERMVNEMSNYSNDLSINLGDTTANNRLANKLKKNGFNLKSQYAIYDGIEFDTYAVDLSSDLNEAYEQLQQIYDIVYKSGENKSFLQYVSNQIDDIETKLNDYGKTWDLYVYNELIQGNDAAKKSFDSLIDAHEKYQESLNSESKTEKENAKDNFIELYNKAIENSKFDDSVKNYIRSSFGDMSSVLAEESFNKLYDDLSSGYVDKIGNALSDLERFNIDSYEKISDLMSRDIESLMQESPVLARAKNVLMTISNETGMAIDEIVNSLRDKGVILEQSIVDLYDKYGSATIKSLNLDKSELKLIADNTSEIDRMVEERMKKLSSPMIEEEKEIVERYKYALNEANKFGADLEKTLYGNIDLNNRKKLEWTKENIEKYTSEILSWEGENFDVNEYLGSYSTVDTAVAGYNGFEIALTPVMTTEDGAIMLSRESVDKYIDALFSNLDSEWNTEDLLKLDAEGLEIDGQHISNIIADIGETAIKTGEEMHFTSDVIETTKDVADAAELAGMSVEEWMNRYDSKNAIDEIKVQQDAIQKFIETSKNAANAISVSEARSSVEGLKKEITSVQSIIEDTANIATDDYETLVKSSNKYAVALKVENGRLVVNKNRLLQVAKSRLKDKKQTLQQSIKVKEHTLMTKLSNLELYKFNLTLQDSIEEKYDDIAAIEQEIAEYQALMDSIYSCSDALEAFKAAQATNDQETYDTAQDAFNVIKGTLTGKDASGNKSDLFGKYNTDDFRTAAKALFSEEDFAALMDADSVEKFQKVASKAMKTLEPLFDENNAKSASNLFKKVQDIIDSGEDIPYNDEEWAKRLGVSVETWEASKQLGNLYGYDGYQIYESKFADRYDDYTNKTLQLADANRQLADAKKEVATDDTEANRKNLKEAENNQRYAQKLYDETTKTNADNFVENVDAYNSKSPIYKNSNDYLDYYSDRETFMAEYESALSEIGKIEDETYQKALDATNQNGTAAREMTRSLLSQNNEWKRLNSSVNQTAEAYERAQRTYKLDEENQQKSQENVARNNIYKSYDTMTSRRDALVQHMASLDVNADASEIKACQAEIDSLDASIGSLQTQIKIDIQTNIDEVQAKIDSLEQKKIEIGASSTKGSSGVAQTEIQKAIDSGKGEIASLQKQAAEYDVKVNLKKGDTSAIENLETNVTANVLLGNRSSIDGLTTSVKANLEPDKSKLTGLTVPVKAKIIGGGDFSDSDLVSGKVGVNGTAHFGSAYADGTIGNSKSEKNVMVGEIAPEMVVDPHTGSYTIYNSPTMLKELPKNAIVFNGSQTEDIIKHGKTSSFGKAYVNGNIEGKAFASGSGSPFATTINADLMRDVYTNNAAIKAAKKAVSSVADSIDDGEEEVEESTEELFDWIERRIKRLEHVFNNWLNFAEKMLNKRLTNSYYEKAFRTLNSEVETYTLAYTRYMKEADAQGAKYGITPEYIAKVQAGLIDIESISDENKKNAINSYQEWFDKAVSAQESFVEKAAELYNLPLEKAKTLVEKVSSKLDTIDKKLENVFGSKGKNDLLSQSIKEEQEKLKIYNDAVNTTSNNVDTVYKQLVNANKKKNRKKNGISKSDAKYLNTADGKSEIDLKNLKEGN